MFFSKWEILGNGKAYLKKLTRGMVSNTLKIMAAANGLPPEHFSSHCLRIGGSTELASSGINNATACEVGVWARGSTSSYKYPEPTSASGAGVLNLTYGKRAFNMRDMNRMEAVRETRGKGSNT
jgi:hypothetical protein